MLTLQNLIADAGQLEKQVEAAANMLQQSAGALQYVRNKIGVLQQEHAEAAKKALESTESIDDEANESPESETPQE